jgi:SnoaL-like polyketide cyclase
MDFSGKACNLGIVDELAAPDMLPQYSLHAPCKGHADIKAFMADFRRAFPDLNFWGAADRLPNGRRHSLVGSLSAATGRKMHFTGTTVLKIKDGKILEEIGLDDGVTALRQLGLIKAA